MLNRARVEKARDQAGEWIRAGDLVEDLDLRDEGTVARLERSGRDVAVELDTSSVVRLASRLRRVPTSICDRCSREMRADVAVTCEACGGTFDPNCYHEHEEECDG